MEKVEVQIENIVNKKVRLFGVDKVFNVSNFVCILYIFSCFQCNNINNFM